MKKLVFPIFVLSFVAVFFLSIYGCGQTVNPTPSSRSWRWLNPLPQGNPLHGVHGSSTSNIFAVGVSGAIVHYDASGNGGTIMHYGE